MTDRDDIERDTPRLTTTEDIQTTDDVQDTDEVITTEDVVDIERGTPARRARSEGPGFMPGPAPEDEEVNPVGSYESWNQSGQGLDAVGAGMTGDEGTIGLTGTGFEDDTEP